MGYLRVYLGNVLKDQIELKSDRFSIGRTDDNDLVLNDPGVSSRHAVIVRDGSKFIIEDSDSTNGVFVNNHRIKKAELKYWDEIQVYNHVLKFMALTSRDDGGDPDIPEQKYQNSAKTTRVSDLSGEGLQALLQKHRKKSAYVTAYRADDTQTRFPFPQTASLTVGRSKDCDIQTGGWFAPHTAAELERNKSGYHLIPYPRGKVILNRVRIQTRKKLEDGDDIKVRNLSLRFFHRVAKDK